MRYLSIIFILLITSCKEERQSLFAEMNKCVYNDYMCNKAIVDILHISEGRNVVFIFDESCSACNAQYAFLCKNLEIGECIYDSLITVVNGSQDMIIADYNLKKFGVKRPINERVIYDIDCKLSNSLYNISDNNCLMLFENKRLLYKTTISVFELQQ